jgi:hypothetical protein
MGKRINVMFIDNEITFNEDVYPTQEVGTLIR